MTDREWSKFFELLEKIVNLPMPTDDKARLVMDQGTSDDRTNVEEFTSWDFEVEDPDEEGD